jgi:hypothetical protein
MRGARTGTSGSSDYVISRTLCNPLWVRRRDPGPSPIMLFRVTSPGSCCSLPRRKLRQAPQQGRDSERKHRAHYPNRQAGDDVQDPSSGSPAVFKKSMQVFKMWSSWDGRDDQRPPIAWVSSPLQSGERSWICPAHHRCRSPSFAANPQRDWVQSRGAVSGGRCQLKCRGR